MIMGKEKSNESPATKKHCRRARSKSKSAEKLTSISAAAPGNPNISPGPGSDKVMIPAKSEIKTVIGAALFNT